MIAFTKHAGFLAALALVLAGPFAAGQDARVEQLADQLKSGNMEAASALLRLGKQGVPGFIRVLQTGETRPRGRAAAALAKLGPDAAEAVPALADVLAEPDDVLAAEAALALGSIGPAATPVLIQALQSGNESVRGHAAIAIRQIGSGARDAAPALIEAFRKASPERKGLFANALGELGPAAREAAPLLLKAAADGEPDVHILVALSRVGGSSSEAVSYLLKVFKSQDPKLIPLRMQVVVALGDVGPQARGAAPLVFELLGETTGAARLVVLETLAKIGGLDNNARPAIYQATRDADEHVRLQAVRILGRIDRDDPIVTSILLETLRDSRDAKLRCLAAEALGDIRPSDEAVPQFLNNALGDNATAVRQAAAQALQRIQKKQ